MDYFSTLPEAIVIPNQEYQYVSEALIWISLFGVHFEIHSYQGRNFDHKFLEKYVKY